MSYVKQNFVDGQTLTAAQLNHMEAGIANAAGTQGEKGDKGDKGDTGPAGVLFQLTLVRGVVTDAVFHDVGLHVRGHTACCTTGWLRAIGNVMRMAE